MPVEILQINKRIEICKLGEELYHSTVIQDIKDETFYILVPYEKGVPLNFKPGEKVQISITSSNAAYKFTSEVINKIKEQVELYSLKMPENIKRIQRRNYVRLPVNLDIAAAYLPLPGESLEFQKARAVDLSAGGIKLICKEKVSVGEKLIIALQMQQNNNVENIKLVGKVLRIEDVQSPYGDNLLGLEFVDISESERDKIVKYIFEKQIELRRAGQIGK